MHDYTAKAENKQLFWSRKMIESFIQLYKENECLYNKNHTDYNNKTVKIVAFKNILHKLKRFLPNLELNDLIEKLTSIRTQFAKEVALVDKARAMGNTYVPKMWCFKQLEFLRQYSKSSSGSKSKPIDSDDTQSDGSDFSSELNISNLSKRSTDYRWERDDLKIFINLFKKYPILYDPKHEHFQNNLLKSKARVLLLKEAQKIDPKINLTIMNGKIRSMTKQYKQELTRMQKAEENNEAYTSRYWCFDLLSFLKPLIDTNIKSNTKTNNETITYADLNDDHNTINVIEHLESGIEHNNEAIEIEPIHQVIIENEAEYDEEMQIEPIEDIKHINQNVIDYEYDENTYDMSDMQHCQYKEELVDNIESQYIEETIEYTQPECTTTKMENCTDKSRNGEHDLKYEWLGKLVVSQLGIIAPKYHSELASDLQNLINDYVVKSKGNSNGQSTDASKQKNDKNDPSSSSNVSFNLRFV